MAFHVDQHEFGWDVIHEREKHAQMRSACIVKHVMVFQRLLSWWIMPRLSQAWSLDPMACSVIDK